MKTKYDLSAAEAILKIFEEKDYPNWYGIDGIKFIWHNAWADPEIEYKGKRCSCYIVEDTMWKRFNEEMSEEKKPVDEDKFNLYMKANADSVYELCELALFSEEHK